MKVEGDVVTRDSLCNNAKVLELAINRIGSRVSVDVIHMHLMALYHYMDVPIQSSVLKSSKKESPCFSYVSYVDPQDIDPRFPHSVCTYLRAKVEFAIPKPGY